MASVMPCSQGMYMTPVYQHLDATPMANWQSNQRSSPRVIVVCPISIEVDGGKAHGIVRDFSTGGIFFYSNFRPKLHSHVDFVLQIKGKDMRGQGEIVRVQDGAPGAATGVAVKVSLWEE